MKDQLDVAKLRDQIAQMQNEIVRRARRAATIFGVVAIAALIAGVYGYVQGDEAKKSKEEVARMVVQVEEVEALAERNSVEANLQRRLATEQRAAAEELLRQTQAELEKCRKGKR